MTVWLGWVAGSLSCGSSARRHVKTSFNENANNGNPYHLVEPTAQTTEAYRFAYRFAYISQASPEVIFETRVTDNNHNSKYCWAARQYMRTLDRQAYCPTQEFVEMFPGLMGKPHSTGEETEKRWRIGPHVYQG